MEMAERVGVFRTLQQIRLNRYVFCVNRWSTKP